MTPASRDLDAVLAAAPHDPGRTDTWLFVYGSMLEGPPFEPVERRVARLTGWRRTFCLADPSNRGTEAAPGLVLGLEPDRACDGLAYRIDARRARDDLARVWEREMALPWYEPRWLPIAAEGSSVNALTFAADRRGPLYRPGLGRDEMVATIADRHGEQGSNADYLFECVEALTGLGIPDAGLEDLAGRVRAAWANRAA